MKIKKLNTCLPAARILFLFESINEYGEAAVANHLGLNLETVRKWAYPIERKGTGGFIPRKYHKKIIEFGKQKNIDINTSDFYSDLEL